MEKVLKIILAVIAGAALILFLLAIIAGGYYTLLVKKPGDMPGFLFSYAFAANGLLAANLGALLGIKISGGTWNFINPNEMFQGIAVAFYLIMLLVAFVLWGLAGFTEDVSKVVSLLPELSKNLLGILLAALGTMLLGKKLS